MYTDQANQDRAMSGSVAGEKPLTKNQAKALRKLLICYTQQHVYTDEEIKNMVKRSIGLDKSKVTEFTTAMESLQKKLATARAETDYEALEVVQKTMDHLQRSFNIQKDKFDKATAKQLLVNKKMRENNVKRDMEAGKRYARSSSRHCLLIVL